MMPKTYWLKLLLNIFSNHVFTNYCLSHSLECITILQTITIERRK